MKPFDLEAAKRGEPIVTRDGRQARFIAHVPDAPPAQRVVCITDLGVNTHYETGDFIANDSPNDLFMESPPMRSINGEEYPEPVRGPLEYGQEFFVANPLGMDFYSSCEWNGSMLEILWLERGLIHLTREAAIAYGRAFASASGGKV